MDLRQLRQFVAVAEESSFRRAAERLHVSQPPLSVAIQKLEADVGVTLLDRTRHHVRLTVAGEAFLREAKRTLAHAQLSIEIAQRAAAGKLGTLRLSFVPSAALNVVPGLLRAFREDYPDVTLVLTSDTTSQQMATLLSGATDVGIVVPPLHDAGDFRVDSFCDQELMLAVPVSHPLAESGVPGYEVSAWFGVFAPAGIPATVTDKLNQSLTAVLKMPDMQKQLRELGAEPEFATPEIFSAYVRSESHKWAQVVKGVNLTP